MGISYPDKTTLLIDYQKNNLTLRYILRIKLRKTLRANGVVLYFFYNLKPICYGVPKFLIWGKNGNGDDFYFAVRIPFNKAQDRLQQVQDERVIYAITLNTQIHTST